MAQTKKRKRTRIHHRSRGGRFASNTPRRPVMHHRPRRHNPGRGRVGELVKTSLAVIGGAVGSKVGTQMILGTNNTGVFGYLGNAVAGGILAWAAKAFVRDPAIAQGIIIGTAVQIILRVIGDQTSFGSYLSLSGLGDYMATNVVQPQRLVDGLNSAVVEIPNGWGQGMLLPAPAARVGVSGLYDGSMPGGGPLY